MALTGTFVADFASFQAACANAEVSLKGFESGAGKVENSLNRMTDSLSGTKIIQQATLMAEAVERVGGISKLTEAELARVGFTAQEAAAKMVAMGVDVPPGIQKIADATRAVGTESATTAPHVNTLHSSLSQFDGVLAAMGIHIGPEIKALGELGEVSGKTASQIGLIGVAGLAVGAALGGWKIGRAIADFFELDQKIGNVTASLLGFGDVAAQTAGAKMDVINKAIAGGADATISYTDAIKFNNEAQEKLGETLNTSAHRVSVWKAEIAAVTAAGTLKQIQADLASQDSTLQQLSTHYKISVDALEYLQRATTAAATAAKEHATALKAEQKAIDDAAAAAAEANQKYLDGLVARWKEAAAAQTAAFTTESGQLAALSAAYFDHAKAINAASHDTLGVQVADAYAAADAKIAAMQKAKTYTVAAEAEIRAAADQTAANLVQKSLEGDVHSREHYQLLADQARIAYDFATAHADSYSAEWIQKLRDTATAAQLTADSWNTSFDGALNTISAKVQAETLSWSQAMDLVDQGLGTMTGTVANAPLTPATRTATQLAWDQGRYFGPVIGGSRENPHGSGPDWTALGYETGGPTVEGLSMLHAGEYVVPKDGALVLGGGGGGGTTIIQLVVDGKVLASVVNAQNTRTMKQGRKWPSA